MRFTHLMPVSDLGRPPFLPLARAALSPACVRSPDDVGDRMHGAAGDFEPPLDLAQNQQTAVEPGVDLFALDR